MLAKISGAFLIQVLGAGSVFLLHLLLAKYMGANEYGLYAYAYAWIIILSVLVRLGMQTSMVKFVAEYRLGNEFHKIKGIVIFANGSVALVSVLIALIAYVVLELGWTGLKQTYIRPLEMACAVLPMYALMGVTRGALQGLKLQWKAQVPDLIFRPVLMLSLVSVILALGAEQHLDAMTVLLFLLIVSLLALLLGMFWLIDALPDGFWCLDPSWESANWWKVSLPLILLAGMHMITQNSDIVMLGYFVKPDEVGIYAVCTRLSGLITFALSASALIVAPMIAERFKAGDKGGLQQELQKISAGVFVFTVLAVLFFVVFGDWLLSLFGKSYVAGHIPLLILAGGQLVNAFVGSAGLVMTMSSHQKEAGKIITIAACLNIILNAVLIPFWDLQGAALATAISMAYWNLGMLLFVHKHENIDTTFLGKVWRNSK